MPRGRKPGPSIKKPSMYEGLKRKGMSKERAAKISNAAAGKTTRGKRRGRGR